MTKRILISLLLLVLGFIARAQTFDWVDRQDNYQAGFGQNLKIPIRIRNTSDKPQFFIIRKAQGETGLNQKAYFCIGDECLEPGLDQFSKRIEPGETLANLYFMVETGLSNANNTFRFEVFPRGNPALGMEHTVSVAVEEKPAKSVVFQSRDISIHDIYPNPIADLAYIDYRLTNETLKAKVVIHNILGSPVGSYELPANESRVKIQADELASGVYFYTVYLDNIGVLTRKLVVRK